jgi:predicted aspartyl protease
MGSAAKHLLHEALLWGAVALGGFALFYFFDDLKAAFAPSNSQAPAVAEQSVPEPAPANGFGGEVRLKADSRGVFQVPAEVNGRPADFMADTGATLVVLT